MTNKQKQLLLAFLGFYEGSVDGIFGPESQAATRAFQEEAGLAPDGIFGKLTESAIRKAIGETGGDFWEGIENFTREEFACPCGRCGGFPAEPSEALVKLADMVRAHFDAPATVSSGVRCQAHNDELPGSAKNSYHVKGKAMDFCVQGVSGVKLLAYVKTLPVHYAYQINGSDFVHMDVN